MKRELYFRLSIPEAIVAGHRLAQDQDAHVRAIGERLLEQQREAQGMYELYKESLEIAKKRRKKSV